MKSSESKPSRTLVACCLAACAVVLAAGILAAFQPALQGEFLEFDDNLNFTSNESFRGLGAEQLEWMFTTGWMGHYQPLSWITLAADYVGAEGLDGPRFHRTNLAWHFVTSFLLLVLAWRLFRGAGTARESEGPWLTLVAALGAAFLFAVHPLRVESVAWITERRDVVSGAFFVAALIVWHAGPATRDARRFSVMRGALAALLAAASLGLALAALNLQEVSVLSLRPAGGWLLAGAVGSLVACVLTVSTRSAAPQFLAVSGLLLLSLLSKAWGLVMPALLLVLDWWPRRRGRPIDLAFEKLPFLAMSGVFAALAVWAQSGLYGTMKTLEDHSIVDRFAQAAYGLAFYPAKTVVPLSLGPFYDLPSPFDPFAPRFVVAGLALLLGGGLLLVLARRGRSAPLVAFAAYAVIVSPVLGLAQSGPQLVAERYTYLSTMPLTLLAGGAGFVLARRFPRARLVVVSLALCVIVGLGFLSHRLSQAWQSTDDLWAHVRAVRPNHPAGWLWEASGLLAAADRATAVDEKIDLLRRSLRTLETGEALGGDPQMTSERGRIHSQLAVLEPERQSEHAATAVDLHRQALETAVAEEKFRPGYLLRLGEAQLEAGRPHDAKQTLRDFLGRRGSSAEGREMLGRAHLALNEVQAALGELERSVQLGPDRATSWRWLGAARGAAGDRSGASRAFQRAVSLDPGSAEYRRLFSESLSR